MATLRELSNNYRILEDMLNVLEANPDKESEEYDEQLKAIQDTMDSIEPVLEDKVDGYCTIINDKLGDIEKLKTDIIRQRNRVKALEHSIEWLKGELYYSMKAQGEKRVKTAQHTCTIATAGQRSLTLKVDPDKLPDEYKIVEYKADNKAIKDMFKEKDIEENDFAVLEPAKESLRLS